jgi:glycine/D-amino acid oxidase-like deaminating enzyme
VLTAHLLKAEGKRVALLEQGRIGQGTTGLTTAKLTVGQGLIYARLLAAHGLEAAKVFAASNAAALARLAKMTTQSAIFLAAWFGQSVTAWTEYNNEQRDHGAESRDAAYATAAEAEPISTPRTSWR